MQHWETVVDNVALPTISELGEMFSHEKNFHFNSSEELDQELCRAFLQFIYFNKEQRDMLYSKTVGQGESSMWMLLRAGRITASNVYKVCYLRESTDPKATVKLLMNYNSTDKVGMAAPLEWGHLKEVGTKELYKKKMVAKHEDFKLLDCGLAVRNTPLWGQVLMGCSIVNVVVQN